MVTQNTSSQSSKGFILIVSIIFLLSGATSLIYQISWMRMLSLFFGSDVYAAAITLSVFMAGLSMGSWCGGRLADMCKRPLLWYGILEIGIGIYAYFFPDLLVMFEAYYRGVYLSSFDSNPEIYQLFRLGVAACLLLIPTFMMGATLPLIIRQFAAKIDSFGYHIGLFYSINTLGALLGTLAAGFVIIPNLGISLTVSMALWVNLIIGVVAIALSRSNADYVVQSRQESVTGFKGSGGTSVFLVVMMLTGVASFALEVVWMRILIQSFSATVYAFSIMLVCFLFGIYYGSHKASAYIDQQKNPYTLLMFAQLTLGVYVAGLSVISYYVPDLFSSVVWGLAHLLGGHFGYSSIAAQFIIAALLILLPTIVLGATFPLATKLYTQEIEKRGKSTGNIYAANTAGAVIGSLMGGFVLLPLIGSRYSLLFIGGIFALAGAILAFKIRDDQRFPALRWLAATVVALGIIAGVLQYMPERAVLNFNMQSLKQPEVIYHGEGVSHNIDIVKSDRGYTILSINGNIEADDSFVQKRHFIMKAHLPLLLHDNPKDVAVVGLGLGITLASTVRHPTVERVRLIELSPEVVDAHQYLKAVTNDVLSNPKINLRIDDGRNFLGMTDEDFDMITADPIHPRVTGVGYLYTKEYYQSIRKRLRPGGVVTQWMPMYRISPKSFDVAFRTFASVFPNSTFWYVRGHGLFVANVDGSKMDWGKIRKRFYHPDVESDFNAIDIESPEMLMGHLLMDSGHIRKYLDRNSETLLNTDDNAYLEYHTPLEYIYNTDLIVKQLLPFSGFDMRNILQNVSEEELKVIKKHYEKRISRILPELNESLK